MEKSTIIEHEVIDAIKKRRSGRAYVERPVEAEKIHIVLEAARWAPSSSNEQPWRYILATKENTELYNKVFDSLADGNKVWVTKAPVLLVSLAKKTFIRNGAVNRHALYDTGAANCLLCLQTSALGLNAHQMGGFDYAKLKESLSLSDDFDIASVISIGYPSDLNELSETLRMREVAPRERYTQAEFMIHPGELDEPEDL
ncbi:MAG TPA: nitroreductase family protein [Cytophagaceae bacterium]|jgi:nitroreductase|nr:nitroreductase family protein [Cytophagaceae bacterium]